MHPSLRIGCTPLNTKEALNRLHRHGIWLGKDVESFLSSAGHELPL